MEKGKLRNARNSVGINLNWICVSDHSPWLLCADGYSSGRVSGDTSADLTWKYYSTRVCLKYNVQLVGFPRADICDPSDLSVKELNTLHESLQNGTCTFKPLQAEDRGALEVMVDEQERSGKNPWGKRKHRSDAGKPRKRRQISGPTVRLGSTGPLPPSCSSLDYQNPERECDSDVEEMSISGTHPDTEQPRKLVHKHSLYKVAPHSSSGSTHIARPSTHPAPITPIMGMRGISMAEAYQDNHIEFSNELLGGWPADRSIDHDNGSVSGEDELAWDGEADLAECIVSFGDSLMGQGWNPEDG